VPKPPAVQESESTITLPGADKDYSGNEQLSSPPPPQDPQPQPSQPATGTSQQPAPPPATP
jgi:hypothetical protein